MPAELLSIEWAGPALRLYLQAPAGFPKGEALSAVPADQRHGHGARGPHRGDPTLTVRTGVPYQGEGGRVRGPHRETHTHTQGNKHTHIYTHRKTHTGKQTHTKTHRESHEHTHTHTHRKTHTGK